MIHIDLLKNHTQHIPVLAKLWHEVLGKTWVPDIDLKEVEEWLWEWCGDAPLPKAFVALDGEKPIGICSLQENDGIRPDIMPWLGDCCVATEYQGQGIGTQLVKSTEAATKALGFPKLYLFTVDPKMPDYYSRLGWQEIGIDEFEGHPVTVMEIAL